ncbi:conserved hypothetical protein [Xenorhabdus nematophila F1]|nr:conserved hypothetical protein [Xenorhabdus nematophila F1]
MGDTFDRAVQSLQFWHSHSITAIPSQLFHDNKYFTISTLKWRVK